MSAELITSRDFDNAAEQFVIGCALADPATILPKLDDLGITANTFYAPRYWTVYEFIVRLPGEGKHVDVISVGGALKTDGLLDEVGGRAQLDLAIDAAFSTAFVEHHAQTLKGHEAQRRAKDVGNRLNSGVWSIDQAYEELGHIQETAVSISTFPAYRLSDLEAYRPDPTHYIAGHGWLKRGGGTLLTGGTGLGKSVLASQIAASVAGGKNILGCIRVEQAIRVLYVQAENDADVHSRVIPSIVGHIGADREVVEQNLEIHHVYALDGLGLARWLEPRLRNGGWDLVAIEPYQSYAGATDINGTESFLQWRDAVEPQISKRIQCRCNPDGPLRSSNARST